MSIRVKKVYLPFPCPVETRPRQETHALLFLPDPNGPIIPSFALFTHGFTSHKASILNWSIRLVEEGVSNILFDLPGHYLGSFSEVPNFDWFKKQAHKFYQQAYDKLKQEFSLCFPQYQSQLENKSFKIILGGHSLGGLLALKALELKCFQKYDNKTAIAVGLGLPPKDAPHVFASPFYKSTLAIRAQLVAPELAPENVFPWIQEEKENMNISQQKIYLLSGEDDVVVGKKGIERMAKILQDHNNQVSLEKVIKLPHHTPELAAPHLKKWLKSQGYLSL